MQDELYGKMEGFFGAAKVFKEIDTPGYNAFKGEKIISEDQPLKLFFFTGPTKEVLLDEIKKFKKSISSQKFEDILPLTINKFEKYRYAALAKDTAQLLELLEKANNPESFNETPQNSLPKLCILVTCQGMQYFGMGKIVYNWSPIFRKYFDHCAKLVSSSFGINIKELMLSEGSSDWVKDPSSFVPYTLALEYSLYRLWEAWGVKPDFFMGMSFGDYGAAVLSGILSLEDAFTLVMARTKLMTENVQKEVFCVCEIDMDEYEEIFQQLKKEKGFEDVWLDIACKNSPKQTCIIGKKVWVEKFGDICKSRGKKMFTNPNYPYHSRFAAPICPQFKKITSSVKYGTTNKFVSSVSGEAMKTLDENYFLGHLTGTANFSPAVKTLLNHDVTHFLEVGPHSINIQMVKDILANNSGGKKIDEFEFVTSLQRKGDDRVNLLNGLGKLFLAGFPVSFSNL